MEDSCTKLISFHMGKVDKLDFGIRNLERMPTATF